MQEASKTLLQTLQETRAAAHMQHKNEKGVSENYHEH